MIIQYDETKLYGSGAKKPRKEQETTPLKSMLEEIQDRVLTGLSTSQTAAPAAQTYTPAASPSYTSRYQSQIDKLTGQLGKGFSYDPEGDPLYEQYRKTYTREGARAMQDTVGQVAARTGGLASSYAATAGAQANNAYMAKLADKVPELWNLAYDMYASDNAAKRADINTLMALEKGDLDRYKALLDQYNRNRDYEYKAWLNSQS